MPLGTWTPGDEPLTLTRDPIGMEPLYFARIGGTLRYGPSAAALQEAGAGRGLDREAALEAVLSADLSPIFGSRTLFAGVSEVEPGEKLVISSEGEKRVDLENPYIEPWSSEPPPDAKGLRAALERAVEKALGSANKIAVALSGGVDSSLLAALCVRKLGAENVTAFTYEFDEPSHGTEAPHAAEICKRLGVEHRVVTVKRADYIRSLPELFRRLEAPRLSPGAWLPFARAIAAEGFDRVITGDGMELALNLTEEFDPSSALARVARRGFGFPHWRLGGSSLDALARAIHPGLASPGPTSYHMTLCVLRHNGLLGDVGSKYPGALSSLVRENAESPRVKEAVARRASLPLSAQLRFHRLNGYYLHRLFRAKRAAFAELGAVPVCPAFFMPPVPRRERWVNDRTLLRAASGEAVPDEVWARPKVKNQSILPSAWREEITGALSPLAHAACERMSVRGEAGEALRRHFGKDLGVLELWARVFEGQTPALDRLFPGL